MGRAGALTSRASFGASYTSVLLISVEMPGRLLEIEELSSGKMGSVSLALGAAWGH